MKNKIKILQVSYCSLAKAGIQAVIMDIVRSLHEEFDFDILLFTKKKEYYDDEFVKYGRIFRISCYDYEGKFQRIIANCLRPFKQLIGSYRLIKKEKYDIVHYHYGLDGFPVLLGAKLAGAKTIIVHGHNTLSPEKRSIPSRLYRFVARQIINLVADERIGCSKEANEFLFGDKPAKVINNPVDIEKFSLEKHPHVPSNKLRITNVGRYCFQKNQEFAIEVFAKVLNSHKDSVLNLVGFGEDKQQLKEKVMQMGLSNDVRFVDGNTSIPEILSQTDIFLFPSRYEGLGIVLIEAQSMGVYCIAADTIPESANVGLCEFVSLNATSDEWAEHVIRAFNDIENGIIDNSIVQVEDYSINDIKRKYVQIYSDKGN